MTILEAENQNLRRRMRELELEFRGLKEMHAHVLKENEQLKGRIAVLGRATQTWLGQAHPHERVDMTFRVDGSTPRGEAAVGRSQKRLKREAPSSRRTSTCSRAN